MRPDLPAVTRLRRHLQGAYIRRYLRKYEQSYSRPALRQQLLAAGYAPHLIDLAMTQTQAPRPLSTTMLRCLFSIAVVGAIVLNVLVYHYFPRYWLGALWAQAFAAIGFIGAGAEPMVATRWSWWYVPRADDASSEALTQRQVERRVMRSMGGGFLVGILLAGVLVLVM